MAEVSFPVAGGAGVTDARYENLIAPISNNGRVAFSAVTADQTIPLVYADNSGRQVKVYPNQAALVRGFRWESGTSTVTVALDANTSGNPRIDLIVLRLSRTTFQVRLAKRNGTPGANPNPPAAVQEQSADGVWELPIATVRVASSGSAGQPSIAPTNVTPLDYFLAPQGVVCHSDRRPPVSNGMLITEYDTGVLRRGYGGNWLLLGEAGLRTKIDLNTYWSGENLIMQRRNGTTFFQGLVRRAVSNLAANVDSLICIVPPEFRPVGDRGITGVVHSGQAIRALLMASNGHMEIREFPAQIPVGASVTFETCSWPSN